MQVPKYIERDHKMLCFLAVKCVDDHYILWSTAEERLTRDVKFVTLAQKVQVNELRICAIYTEIHGFTAETGEYSILKHTSLIHSAQQRDLRCLAFW